MQSKLSKYSRWLLLLTSFLLWAGTLGAQSTAMKRGRDWMELKQYERAIHAFQKAIEEEPKNVEARYLIARCYYLQAPYLYLEALKWIDEALRISPQHSDAFTLRSQIQSEAVGFLGSTDERVIENGLEILERVPTPKAVAPLKNVMASPTQRLAETSAALLLRINKAEARALWISWLTSSDLRLREVAAGKLWNLERYPGATPILRDKYVREIEKFEGMVGNSARPVIALVDLGWDEALPILQNLTEKYRKTIVAQWTYQEIVKRKERRALSWIRKLVEASAALGEKGGAYRKVMLNWYSGAPFCLGYLGEQGDVALLKRALERVLAYDVDHSGYYLFDLPEKETIESLARLTGDPRWKWFPVESIDRFWAVWELREWVTLGVISSNLKQGVRDPALFEQMRALLFDARYTINMLVPDTPDTVSVHSPDRFDIVLQGLKNNQLVTKFMLKLGTKPQPAPSKDVAWEIVGFVRIGGGEGPAPPSPQPSQLPPAPAAAPPAAPRPSPPTTVAEPPPGTGRPTPVTPQPPEAAAAPKPSLPAEAYQLANQGFEAFRRGMFGEAANYFERAINLGISDAPVLSLAGASYYFVRNLQRSQHFAQRAVEAGGFAAFPVRHNHFNLLAPELATGLIEISREGIKFSSDNCMHSFGPMPWAQVTKLGVLINPFLHMEIPDGSGKTRRYDFADIHSQYQQNRLYNWNDAGQALRTIFNVIQWAKNLQPSAPISPTKPGPTTPPPSTGTSPCSAVQNAGYSILAGGRVYVVTERPRSTGGKLQVFFDQQGAQVKDAALVQRLTAAAWTRENILLRVSPQRERSNAEAVLSTAVKVQQYGLAQDLLARATVEALAGALTSGATLQRAVANVTWKTVRDQLSDPETYLLLTARVGLESSVETYREVERIYPPTDASVLSETDLEQIRNLYWKANGLSLAYGALATSLMPKNARDLVGDFLESALDQLVPKIVDATTPVTYGNLFDLQERMALLSTTAEALSALRSFAEKRQLALGVTQAAQKDIGTRAAEAAQDACPK